VLPGVSRNPGSTGFCTGMKAGAPRVCATGKNPAHYGIFHLWKLLWHGRVVPAGPVPAPPRYLHLTVTPHITNLATAAHHSLSLLACTFDLPSPSPTHVHGHRYKCAAFCGVHPSHTQLASSVFPISLSHCRWGPLSVSRYVSPLRACRGQLRCSGARVCSG